VIGDGTILVLSTTLTLVLILDPFGNIPLFLSLLRNMDPLRRRKVIVREMLIALAALIGFLVAGGQFLAMFQLSQSSLQIAGGVVMFLIAIKMIFPSDDDTEAHEVKAEPLIVPLAIPLVAGPAAMATLILLQARDPARLPIWALSVLLAWLVTVAILLSADYLNRLLGERVIEAMERLMGMLLTTMAVEMLVKGVKQAFTT